MFIDRWYSMAVFCGISVLAHLGLVLIITGFHAPAPTMELTEIEIGSVPIRPVQSVPLSTVGASPGTPKLLRKHVNSLRPVTRDPFAALPGMAPLRPMPVLAIRANQGDAPQARAHAQPFPGMDTRGSSSYSSAGFGGGGAPNYGAPRMRTMGVRAMETPAHIINFDAVERPAFASAPRGGPHGGTRSDGSVRGDQTGSVSVDSGPVAAGLLGEGAVDRPGEAQGADPARRQESFVPAKPKYRTNPSTGYPDAARIQRQQGVVMLRVAVNVQGDAESVQLEQTSNVPLLDDAALASVRNWSFEPARNRSGPVRSWLILPIRFALH